MKVVHFFRTSAAGYGLERNILCTLPGLVERGIEVTGVGVTEEHVSPAAPDFVERLQDSGVRWTTIESCSRLPFALARRLSHILSTEKPDIVHSHGYKCDVGMLLANTGDAVRMTTVHGWLSRNVLERFYEWINVQSCKRLDRVIVFCEDYRRRLLSRGVPDKVIRVIPVGLDTRVVPRMGTDFRNEWGVPENGLLIAQIGRLSPEKHPEMFIEVACRLSEKFPHARFVLVGDGTMRKRLEQTVMSAGKGDVIRFAGYVHEVADVADAIDIGVNCSATEGIPRTLLEAGAAGVPVVATDVGGVPDALDDGVTGILCPSGDARAIEAGLTRLLEDVELRAKMGAAARDRVATVFSIEMCSWRLIAEYETLLADRAAGPE